MKGIIKLEFFDKNNNKYFDFEDHNIIVDNSSAIMSLALSDCKYGINALFIGNGGNPLMDYEGTTKLGNQVAIVKINNTLAVSNKSISFANLSLTVSNDILTSTTSVNEFALGYIEDDEQIIFNYKYLKTPVTVNPGGTIKVGWTIDF